MQRQAPRGKGDTGAECGPGQHPNDPDNRFETLRRHGLEDPLPWWPAPAPSQPHPDLEVCCKEGCRRRNWRPGMAAEDRETWPCQKMRRLLRAPGDLEARVDPLAPLWRACGHAACEEHGATVRYTRRKKEWTCWCCRRQMGDPDLPYPPRPVPRDDPSGPPEGSDEEEFRGAKSRCVMPNAAARSMMRL